MRFSLFALIRLVGLLSVGMVVLAVALARLGSPPGSERLVAAPLYDVLNRIAFAPHESEPLYLDPETGQVHGFTLPQEDRLDYAVCSPWTDESGEYQVVGRWKSRPFGRSDDNPQFDSFGLARYEVPSGRVLDQVALEILPSSPPCWYPGTAARVLYTANDGSLYSYDFDSAAAGKLTVAKPLTWRCEPPGDHMIISDPVWPRDPRFGGRLIVSIQHGCTRLSGRMTPSRLWWLSLSTDGLSVVGAGPLIDPSEGDSRSRTVEERCPKMAVVPGGGLMLAYLWQLRSLDHWDLRLAPVSFDEQTHVPVVDSRTGRTLQQNHVPSAATFSPDGRWIFGFIHDHEGHGSIIRFPTTPLLPIAARIPLPRTPRS